MNIDFYVCHVLRGDTMTPPVRLEIEFDTGACKDNGCHVELRGEGLQALTVFADGSGISFDLMNRNWRDVLGMLGETFLAANKYRPRAHEQAVKS